MPLSAFSYTRVRNDRWAFVKLHKIVIKTTFGTVTELIFTINIAFDFFF